MVHLSIDLGMVHIHPCGGAYTLCIYVYFTDYLFTLFLFIVHLRLRYAQ